MRIFCGLTISDGLKINVYQQFSNVKSEAVFSGTLTFKNPLRNKQLTSINIYYSNAILDKFMHLLLVQSSFKEDPLKKTTHTK